jgi:hypothetical protein
VIRLSHIPFAVDRVRELIGFELRNDFNRRCGQQARSVLTLHRQHQ